jgi:sulfofructose kinase
LIPKYADFIISSKDLRSRRIIESKLLRPLSLTQGTFKCRLIAAELGYLGVIGWDGRQSSLCRAYKVNAVDTTAASDIFNAFPCRLTQKWPIQQILEFNCAAAALNCGGLAERGNTASFKKIQELLQHGDRSEAAFSPPELLAVQGISFQNSRPAPSDSRVTWRASNRWSFR